MRCTVTAAIALALASVLGVGSATPADKLCEGYGPQTPRDISSPAGANRRVFAAAPAASRMNLSNIHTHTNAEHKGPGFSVSAGCGEHGGWKCNETGSLTETELFDPADGDGAFQGIKQGDTIEVHWVYTTCDAAPGETLGACITDACSNPQLRVEAQVFLVVNDPQALDFPDFVGFYRDFLREAATFFARESS